MLKGPVADLRALDAAVLDQFGLPLWPHVTLSRQDGKVELSNDGTGVALAVSVHAAQNSPGSDTLPPAFDLVPGESVTLPSCDSLAAVDVRFEKLERTYGIALPIIEKASSTGDENRARTLPSVIIRKRLTAQRTYRKTIDPQEIVVGSSPALLEVFEQIHHANSISALG